MTNNLLAYVAGSILLFFGTLIASFGLRAAEAATSDVLLITSFTTPPVELATLTLPEPLPEAAQQGLLPLRGVPDNPAFPLRRRIHFREPGAPDNMVSDILLMMVFRPDPLPPPPVPVFDLIVFFVLSDGATPIRTDLPIPFPPPFDQFPSQPDHVLAENDKIENGDITSFLFPTGTAPFRVSFASDANAMPGPISLVLVIVGLGGVRVISLIKDVVLRRQPPNCRNRA